MENTPQKSNFSLSWQGVALLAILATVLGGMMLGDLAPKLSRAAEENLNSEIPAVNAGNLKIAAWYDGVVGAVKNVLNSKTAEKVQIKVVSEESQVIDVVKKAAPAVVSIVASAEVPVYENVYEEQNFGGFFNFQVPVQRQNGTEKKRIGAGSGFLVSSDGYIITNKHVVADEKAEYTVFLNDEKHNGEKAVAKVLARDPNNDIAVLKIEVKDLPYLTFGDSKQLQIGQTAIAIGYALGEFDNTVSKGVVSGLGRKVTASGSSLGTEVLNNLIQTDAAINPGNSGGPLLNIDGQVIGINVAMADAQSIGFAIPAAVASLDFDQVKSTGAIEKIDSGFLGVRYLAITDEIKSKNNLSYDYGALVVRGETAGDLAVTPGSPADKAGITENDIILEIDGVKITERQPLQDLIAKYKPGAEVSLKFFHKGEVKTVKVKLEKKK